MALIEHDSIDALLAAYRADLDVGRSDRWWSEARYQAPIEGGTITLYPLTVQGEPGGPLTYGWLLSASVGIADTERRFTGDGTPDAETVADEIAGLAQQAAPVRDNEHDRYTRLLTETADTLTAARAAQRQYAVEAVGAGMQKSTVAQLARVSRPTLDAWLTQA